MYHLQQISDANNNNNNNKETQDKQLAKLYESETNNNGELTDHKIAPSTYLSKLSTDALD